jgi:hypothetical protein
MFSDTAVVALVTGWVTLVNRWRGEGEFRVDNVQPSLAAIPPPLAILAIGWATITPASILTVVVLHTLAI